jgi:DNA primase
VPLAQQFGINLHAIDLGQAKDPDELIKQDVSAWKQAIAGSKEIRDFWIHKYSQELDLSLPGGKEAFKNRMAPILKLYANDTTGQQIYINHIQELTGLDAKMIIKSIEEAGPLGEQQRYMTSKANAPKEAATRVVPKAKPAKQLLEESVLAINLAYPEVRLSLDDLTPAHFSDPDHQLIVETMQQVEDESITAITSRLPNQADYVKILVLRGEEEYDSFAPADRSLEAFELVRRLQIATNKDTKTKLSQKLREAQANGDAKLAQTLLVQYQSLMTEDN